MYSVREEDITKIKLALEGLVKTTPSVKVMVTAEEFTIRRELISSRNRMYVPEKSSLDNLLSYLRDCKEGRFVPWVYITATY